MNQTRLLELISEGCNTTEALTMGADAMERQSVLMCIQDARREGVIEVVQKVPKRNSEKGKIIYQVRTGAAR